MPLLPITSPTTTHHPPYRNAFPSYFSYANWITDCWELTGTKWWPEYDYPLGEPTSPPNTRLPGKRWKYARNFSSGTTVYVDVATRVTTIHWAKK
jgi:hypothetical protein